MTRRIEIPNLDDILELYKSGMPLQRLSKETGYTRTILSNRIQEAGIKIRSYSDGQRARWRDAGDRSEAAEKWLGNAWTARRGQTDLKESLAARAVTKFANQSPGRPGKDEARIIKFIKAFGLDPLWQYPVGPYNLDIALNGFPIAIEITFACAKDFNTGNFRKRLKYLLDKNWFVLYIVATRRLKRFKNNGGPSAKSISLKIIGKDLITWLNHASSNESLAGHYWVIYGQGKMSSIPSYDLNELPLVPSSLCPDEIS